MQDAAQKLTSSAVPDVFHLNGQIFRDRDGRYTASADFSTSIDRRIAKVRVNEYLDGVMKSLAYMEDVGIDVMTCGKTLASWLGQELH
jgi:hypothetical protein